MTVFFICDAHVHERQNLSVRTKLVQMAQPVWPETPGLSAALACFDKRNALVHAVLKAHGSGAESHQ